MTCPRLDVFLDILSDASTCFMFANISAVLIVHTYDQSILDGQVL